MFYPEKKFIQAILMAGSGSLLLPHALTGSTGEDTIPSLKGKKILYVWGVDGKGTSQNNRLNCLSRG